MHILRNEHNIKDHIANQNNLSQFGVGALPRQLLTNFNQKQERNNRKRHAEKEKDAFLDEANLAHVMRIGYGEVQFYI